MSTPRLRPLGIGEILDVAIKIYWRNARTLLPLVAIVVFPAQLLGALIVASAAPNDEFFTSDFGTDPTTDPDFSGSDFAALFVGIVGAGVISWVSTTIATGAAFKAVAEAYLGARPDWRESLAFVLRRVHSILWLSFLSVLVIGIGLVLCVVPGVYLAVAFTVAVPVLLTEGLRGPRALGRSRELVRGRWWQTLAIVVLGSILAGIVASAVQALATLPSFTDAGSGTLSEFLVGTIAGTLAATLTTPFQAAYTTVLYFDLRVRKEAFDLKLIAQAIGVEPTGLTMQGPEPIEPEAGEEQPPFWPPPPGWRPRGGAEDG